MTQYEQQMISMGCPECGADIELYETNIDGNGGKYRCTQCKRDSVWAVGWAVGRLRSFANIIYEYD